MVVPDRHDHPYSHPISRGWLPCSHPMLVQGGPAHLSGRIASGDKVLEIDGTQVHDIQTAMFMVTNSAAGTLIRLNIRRSSDLRTETVQMLRQTTVERSDDREPCGIAAALNVIHEGVRVDQVTAAQPPQILPSGPA